MFFVNLIIKNRTSFKKFGGYLTSLKTMLITLTNLSRCFQENKFISTNTPRNIQNDEFRRCQRGTVAAKEGQKNLLFNPVIGDVAKWTYLLKQTGSICCRFCLSKCVHLSKVPIKGLIIRYICKTSQLYHLKVIIFYILIVL